MMVSHTIEHSVGSPWRILRARPTDRRNGYDRDNASQRSRDQVRWIIQRKAIGDRLLIKRETIEALD
jgi:hypothetical protein